MNINYAGFGSTIKEIIRSSVEDNLQNEGRFGSGIFGGGTSRWKPSLRAQKQSGKTLQDTGQLAASIQVSVQSTGGLSINEDGVLQNNGSIEIKVGSNKTTKTGFNLAQIHNFGAKPKVTERSRKFFFAKWKETKQSFWLSMARTKKTEFNIPARPFLVLQDEDIVKISEKFTEYLGKM